MSSITFRLPNFILSIYTLLLISAAHTRASNSLVEPGSRDNSPSCDCYLTSGPDPSYFQYHRFWDFRSVSNDVENDYIVAPPLITDSENDGQEDLTSQFFNCAKWNEDWSIQNFSTTPTEFSPIMSVNSPQNIYISRNSTDGSTYLTLRASRLKNFMSIAEIDSNQKNLMHSSIRARMRVIPNGLSNASAPSSGDTSIISVMGSNTSHPVDEGAVVGLFTYYDNEQESDIEILTSDPITQIRYSNQPDYNYRTDSTVPDASTDFHIPDGFDWTQWLDHRIDWHDGISRWYINDLIMLNKTKNVPTKPSGLVLNLWGDGGDWSSNMSVGGQVELAVEWIEAIFNISGKVDGPGEGDSSNSGGGNGRKSLLQLVKRKSHVCRIGCDVDGVQRAGFPEVAYNSSAVRVGGYQPGGPGGSMVVLVVLVVVGAFFL